MKRLYAAILLLVMISVSSAAFATAVTFENLHYGQEAFEMHLNDETNTIVFEGESYSLNDDCVEYKDRCGLYGGKTRAVYEMTVPTDKFTVEDNGTQVVFGDWYIDIPYRAELWIARGNRISGEYVVEGPIDLTETYHEEIVLERDETGNPVLLDRIYLYRYQVGDEVRRFAATLYIDYENYAARRPDSGEASANPVRSDEHKAAPAAREKKIAPYAIAAGVLAVGGAVVIARKKRKKPEPVAISAPEEDYLAQGREMLSALQAEEENVGYEPIRLKTVTLRTLFGDLLEMAQSHPRTAARLRKHITYYLPVALKLIRFWQSVEARETDEARYAEAMDSVCRGMEMIVDVCRFSMQDLQEAELMNISTDLAALEQMLKREGVMDSGLKISIGDQNLKNEP